MRTAVGLKFKIISHNKTWFVRERGYGLEISSNGENWYLLLNYKKEIYLNEVIEPQNLRLQETDINKQEEKNE